MKKTPYTAVILAVFCQILWGVVFPVIKKSYQLFAINDIGSTFMFAGIRFMTAGMILLAVQTVRSGAFPVMRKKDAPALFLLGSVQTGLTYGFQFAAMISAASINCSILNGTSFIFMMIFAALMFRDDPITSKKVIGAALGFSGILVCFLSKDAFQTFSPEGEGLMLLSIMLFAFGTSLSGKVTKDIHPAVASGYNLLIGGAELFILSLILGGRLGNGGVYGWLCLAFLAMASSVCLMLWTSLVSKYGVGRIAVFQCVNPLSGAIAAALLLGENVFRPRYIISLILVVLGILIVNTDFSRLKASH
ncbi:MAG: DMT family transporter [Bullifex sp.]